MSQKTAICNAAACTDLDLAQASCFTPGTRIATPKGERRVEELQAGDRVITRDNGIQAIRNVTHRDLSGADLRNTADVDLVLIQQGALSEGLPERDMLVTANHRMLIAGQQNALFYEDCEVLVAAGDLTARAGIDLVEASQATCIHLMFDAQEVILSDGTWSESAQPDQPSQSDFDDVQGQKITSLFEESTNPGEC